MAEVTDFFLAALFGDLDAPRVDRTKFHRVQEIIVIGA